MSWSVGPHRCSAPRGWPGETRVLPELLCKGWEKPEPLSCGSGSAQTSSPFGDAAVPQWLCSSCVPSQQKKQQLCGAWVPAGLNVALRGLLLGESQLKWWELLSKCFPLQLSAPKGWDAAGWVVQSRIPQPHTVVPLLGELPAGVPPAVRLCLHGED